MIKISFIVIGYNISNYIEKCIRSIMKQNFVEFEIIYVDDGSTDDTLAKVFKLQEDDKRLRIIQQKNSGANSARKNGFKHSKGKYIIFIDGDDFIHNNLAYDVWNVQEERNVDIICFNHYYEYENRRRLDNRILTADKSKSYLELILSQELPHELWNKAYKRDFLENAKFTNIKDITMGDDLLANVSLAIHNPSFYFLKDGYYYYLQRQDAVTKKTSLKTLEIITALEGVENILKENKVFEKYLIQVEFLWFYHCYYSKVINVKAKRCEIEYKLYSKWKNKNIQIEKNYLYNNFVKKIGKKNKMKLILFKFNYKIASFIF